MSSAVSGRGSATKTILSVDDNAPALDIRNRVLEMQGYKVIPAPDARTAVELFAANHIDLVITDNVMPLCSGVQLIAELKALRPSIPMVLLSGLQAPDECKADACIVKGSSTRDLLEAVAGLLNGSRLRPITARSVRSQRSLIAAIMMR